MLASAPGTSGNNFYADSTHGGSGAPLDGELGVGTDETIISRLRRASTENLTINDQNNPSALDLGVYFSTGGDGVDLTVYLQTTSDGLVSFAVADTILSSGGNWLNLTLPTAGRSLLDNLATGDRFIFAMARPAADDHAVAAGDASWTFATTEPTVTRVHSHTVDVSDAAFSFALPEPATQRGRARNAGDASWAFALPQPTVSHARAHGVDAGDASWAFAFPVPGVSVSGSTQANAGDVDFTFAVPEPTGFVARGRNPGDAGFSFVVSEPTVTVRRGNLTDTRGVQTGHSLPLSQPSSLAAPPASMLAMSFSRCSHLGRPLRWRIFGMLGMQLGPSWFRSQVQAQPAPT